jgi:hypothetical protein
MSDTDKKIKSELLKTKPSEFWKYLVNIFLTTITPDEERNFKLAASKFATREPHLFIKDVPWFKEWYKTNKEKYVDDTIE